MKYLDVPSSGSIADRTHSHNRAGQYTRNRRSPVQPIGTGRRAFIRAAFGNSSTAWAGLSTVEQAAWDSFAADHPVTDALGQSIILTGHQMFVAIQTNRQNTGRPITNSVPGSTTVPDLSGLTVAFSVATGVSIDGADGDGADEIVVSYSKPMGTGRRFVSTFWQPLDGDNHAAISDLPYLFTTAKYQAEFGTVSVGDVVFIKVLPMNDNGWTGTPVVVRTVLVS